MKKKTGHGREQQHSTPTVALKRDFKPLDLICCFQCYHITDGDSTSFAPGEAIQRIQADVNTPDVSYSDLKKPCESAAVAFS